MGLRLSSLTLSSLAKTIAAAPSFIVLALAAVIVPDLSNAGRNEEILSKLLCLVPHLR